MKSDSYNAKSRAVADCVIDHEDSRIPVRESDIGIFCREMVAQELNLVDLTSIENRVLDKIRKKRRLFKPARLIRCVRWPHVWAPVLATVCMILAFLFISRPQAPQAPVPSALVQSFKGNIASVMILQTPETHQTVVWYKETF